MTRQMAKPVRSWQLRISGPLDQSAVARFGTQRRTPWPRTRLLLGYLTVLTLLTAIVLMTDATAGV
jgi:hypothetical protein